MPKMNKLLPCPFCGSDAESTFVFGRPGISCTKCNAFIRCDLGSEREDAEKEWNKRTTGEE